MKTVPQAKKKSARDQAKESPLSIILRLIFTGLFAAGAIWFIYNCIQLGFTELAVVLSIITVMVVVIFLHPAAYPYRWMAIGLSFLILFTIYPIFFTLYVAFTNYGDGHLITEKQALREIMKKTYLPETGKAYTWTAYKAEDGHYALWIQDKASGEAYLAKEGEELIPGVAGQNGIGELDANGIPLTVEGYTRLNAIQAVADKNLPNIKFGSDPTIQIRSPSEAAELLPLYVFDEETNTLTDQQTGEVYEAINGTFTSKTGKTIIPGFRATIGFDNFRQFITSPALRGPLIRILTWNFIFPLLSVFTTFTLGLMIALMFNDPHFPFKKIIRSFLLIPYTIPGLITIIMWRGMLNPDIGIINRVLNQLFGISPKWFTEPILAQAALVLVNLWLGYPYFMLVTSGALTSIPADLYEAATVDGANAWHKFKSITLPLLLVAVGPLLIASYVFNFNNFNLIYLFIGGGPPIVGAATRAGHTDILISYVYALAFDTGGRGVQYGFASAITIIIFIIVGAITLFQFRFTNMWEEVSENV